MSWSTYSVFFLNPSGPYICTLIFHTGTVFWRTVKIRGQPPKSASFNFSVQTLDPNGKFSTDSFLPDAIKKRQL